MSPVAIRCPAFSNTKATAEKSDRGTMRAQKGSLMDYPATCLWRFALTGVVVSFYTHSPGGNLPDKPRCSISCLLAQKTAQPIVLMGMSYYILPVQVCYTHRW